MGRHLVRAIAACAVAMMACSSAAGGGPSAGPSDGGSSNSGSCDADPLKTGLVAVQTGISADAFDCEILKHAARLNEPDPMIFKAIMYGESRFDKFAAGCPNKPCGTPSGWSADETGCYGLMQVVPACKGPITAPLLLPNGHPNMTKDPNASDWPGSVFNPDANVSAGIGGIADNRAQVKKQFPGCTEDQYT